MAIWSIAHKAIHSSQMYSSKRLERLTAITSPKIPYIYQSIHLPCILRSRLYDFMTLLDFATLLDFTRPHLERSQGGTAAKGELPELLLPMTEPHSLLTKPCCCAESASFPPLPSWLFSAAVLSDRSRTAFALSSCFCFSPRVLPVAPLLPLLLPLA